uniref:TIR domain-containing protein n=1 Tax=Candidatus Kentrum sp. TUN TaxID=2126343 RepID=A0A450ZJ10_9GAMM|nr:MAG: TIR domain-containing protein [Candidatus Kentron sp. TUN]VFK67812.1 MAG: TIR domain-containing protein [Candidatus Kentron sp. TUN]
MNTDKTTDVFLSFNSKARETVEKIAIYLEDKANLQVWFEPWRLIPGKSAIHNIERGLSSARTCAVFVGADGQGPWQRKEVEAAIRRQIEKDDFRVIPVRLPGAPKPQLPAFLANNTWIEFSEDLADPAMWRLECGIRGQAPGRGRPAQNRLQETTPQDTAPPVADSPPPLDLIVEPTQKPAYVFISYRHREPDSGLARVCAAALQQAGHQVFIDTGIPWGTEWAQEIQTALERCDYLLLLLSAESAHSEMVVKEVEIAAELAQNSHGIPRLLPVRVRFPFGAPCRIYSPWCWIKSSNGNGAAIRKPARCWANYSRLWKNARPGRRPPHPRSPHPTAPSCPPSRLINPFPNTTRVP